MKLLCCTLALLICNTLCPAQAIDIPTLQAAADQALTGNGELLIVDEPGQESRFTLPSNPTTGYRWIASGGEEFAEVVIYAEEREAPEEGVPFLVGAPGREIVSIKSLKPGACDITLLYARPWEKPLKAARTIRIKLHIVQPK